MQKTRFGPPRCRSCVPPLPVGRQEMPRAAAGAHPGMLKAKSWLLSRHRDVSAAAASTFCIITWAGSFHTFVPQFPPPARGAPTPAAVQALAPAAPCQGSSTCCPCPAAGLHARQDTSSSCLFLGIHTSASQPSFRPRAGGVTAQTHKPVGAAASSPQKKDCTAWGKEGADPKTHPTLRGTTEPRVTPQPSLPTLPSSHCLCCQHGSECQRRGGSKVSLWVRGCQAQAGLHGWQG